MVKQTFAYKNCRFIMQIFTLIGIITNICVFFLNIYYYAILKIESTLMAAYFITHTEIGLLFVGGNLVILIFGNCGVTSAKKPIMKLFSKVAFLYSMVTGILVLYLLTIYRIEFDSRAGEAIASKTQAGGLILGMYSNSLAPVALKKTTESFNYLLFTTCFNDLLSVAIIFLNIIVVKIILNIKLTQKEKPIPTIESIKHVGMNTGSLKKRRIIAMDNTSVIHIE